MTSNIGALWFDTNGSLRRYDFQTIVDTLAYAENIPLSVLNWEALINLNVDLLWELDDKPSSHARDKLSQVYKDMQQLFSSSADPGKERTKLSHRLPPALLRLSKHNYQGAKQLARLEEHIWLNRPSNSIPIHTLFRYCAEWCWFVLGWFFHERDSLRQAADTFAPVTAYYIPVMEFHLRWLDLGPGSGRHMLVIGPIYKPTESALPGPAFEESHGKPLRDCFRCFHQLFARESLTPLSPNDVMRRMIYARVPLLKHDLAARIALVQDVMQMMTEGLLCAEDTQYSYDDLFKLVQALVVLQRVRDILREVHTERLSGLRAFQCYFAAFANDSTQNATVIRVKLPKSEDRMRCETISFNVPAPPQLIKSSCYVRVVGDNIEQDLSPEIQGRLNAQFAHWNDELIARRHAAMLMQGIMLNEWLQNHYADMDLRVTEPVNEGFYHYVCSNLLEGLRADLCHYYLVEHITESVKLLGAVYSLTEMEKYEGTIRSQMEQISDPNKNVSAVFRVFRNGTSEYYPVVEEDNPRLFLEGVPAHLRPKSIIIVPVTFQGRVYAILEVKGLRSRQFQWRHFLHASSIAAVLGDHAYNQRMLYALQQMTRYALQHEQLGPESPCRYEPLCCELSRIFLTQGANLWIRRRDKRRAYQLVGTTHPNNFPLGPNNPLYLEPDQSTDRTAAASELIRSYLKTGRIFLNARVDDQVTHSAMDPKTDCYVMGIDYWASRPHRSKLAAKRVFQELMVFLLTDTRTKLKNPYAVRNILSAITPKPITEEDASDRSIDDIVGFVTLYHPSHFGYGPNWQNIVGLVSEQLVISLKTLRGLASQKINETNLLMHEIRQDGVAVHRITGQIAESLRTLKNVVEHSPHIRGDFSEFMVRWRSMSPEGKQNAMENIATFYDVIGEIKTLWRSRVEERINNLRKTAARLQHKLRLRELNKKIDLTLLYGDPAPDFNQQVETIPLITVWNDLQQAKRADIRKKGCFVDIDIPKNVSFEVHPNMFYNLLLNLFDNAVKYSHPHTVISINLKEDRSVYKLNITNEGESIGSEELDLDLFEPGVRSRGAQTKDETGEGLGLYIVKLICEFMRMRCEVDRDLMRHGRYVFTLLVPRNLVVIG